TSADLRATPAISPAYRSIPRSRTAPSGSGRSATSRRASGTPNRGRLLTCTPPIWPTPARRATSPRTRTNPASSSSPGSAPLFRNGRLVGGLGVSGDDVEQDDYVTAAGAAGYEPPPELRADQILLRGVRLPYWKFPRNPEQ